MKQLNELGDILKRLENLNTLLVGPDDSDNIETPQLKKIRLGTSGYCFYIPRDTAYATIYSIKRIFEIELDVYRQNKDREKQLGQFTSLAEELLETSEYGVSKDMMEIRGFGFLNGLMDYAIVKNGDILINNNIDKYTLSTSLLKLRGQAEFCMFVKNGEVFGSKTTHFTAIVSSDSLIDEIIKTMVKVRLTALNRLYENEIFLNELKNINIQLEKTIKERTKEIENKNKLLEKEKSKLNELNSYLDSLSRIDPLTKLSNRRDLQEMFQREIKESGGKQRSLIVGDVDHFKAINDKFGHDCGDEVLVKVADIFRGNLRPEDMVCRYGGEEFVIFLAESDDNYSLLVAERLRTVIEKERFEYHDEPFRVTMSFGLINFKGEQNFAQCFKLADKALYQAKTKGRNKTVVSV